ncbi:MAG TPA: metallophosphoesterase, partial [Brevundimonas sp.]
MPLAAPSRRRFLAGAAALPLVGGSAALALDQPPAVIGRVLAMSDLHSAYERSAQLLAALRAEVRSRPIPHLIAVDGDIFEHGNVVSVRSEGAIDWAFLAALPAIAPTVVNLGNH